MSTRPSSFHPSDCDYGGVCSLPGSRWSHMANDIPAEWCNVWITLCSLRKTAAKNLKKSLIDQAIKGIVTFQEYSYIHITKQWHDNCSINQSTHNYVAPYVASESEADDWWIRHGIQIHKIMHTHRNAISNVINTWHKKHAFLP